MISDRLPCFTTDVGNVGCYDDLLSSLFVVVAVYPLPRPLLVGDSPVFPHVIHQAASPSIWPAVHSLRRGLSTNPGMTMWCVCG